MSYQRVKNLVFTQDEIVCYNGSNNVQPTDWNTYTMPRTEENMRDVFKWLCGGVWRPEYPAKWWVELMKRSFMNECGYYLGYKEKPTSWDDYYKPKLGEWGSSIPEKNYLQFRGAVMVYFNIQ